MGRRLVLTALAALVLACSAHGQNISFLGRAVPTRSAAGLIQSTNLVYQGAFRMPAASLDFAGIQIHYYAANDSLFITCSNSFGADCAGMVKEISIPAMVNSSTLSSLNRATLLQSAVDITEGHILDSDPLACDTGHLMSSAFPYGGKLIGTVYGYYDGCSPFMSLSHFTHSLTLATSSYAGLWSIRVASANSGWVGKYMANVPSAWQAALGSPVVTGACCLSVITRTSYGPTMTGVDPAVLTGTPSQTSGVAAAGTLLLGYDNSHTTLGPWAGGANQYFGLATNVGGVVMPNGWSTALFFGTNSPTNVLGITFPCYGTGTTDIAQDGAPFGPFQYCYDPPNAGSEGSHAFPYQQYVWAYDLNDIAAVKAGTKQPYEPIPYAVWSLDFAAMPLPTYSGTASAHLEAIGGVTYRPSDGMIFVVQLGAEAGGYPLIHGYKVQ